MKEMNEGNKSTERLEIVLAKQKELYTKKLEEIQPKEKQFTETVVKQWEKFFEEFIIPNLDNFNNDEIIIKAICIETEKKNPGCATISFLSMFDFKNMLKLDIEDSELMTFIGSNSEYTVKEKFEETMYAPYFEISLNIYDSSTSCIIDLIYK